MTFHFLLQPAPLARSDATTILKCIRMLYEAKREEAKAREAGKEPVKDMREPAREAGKDICVLILVFPSRISPVFKLKRRIWLGATYTSFSPGR